MDLADAQGLEYGFTCRQHEWGPLPAQTSMTASLKNALAGLAVGDFIRCKCLVSTGERSSHLPDLWYMQPCSAHRLQFAGREI